MCWNEVECGRCGEIIQCIAACGCTDEKECHEAGHRDCKEVESCSVCNKDLCESCEHTYLEKTYCDECLPKKEIVSLELLRAYYDSNPHGERITYSDGSEETFEYRSKTYQQGNKKITEEWKESVSIKSAEELKKEAEERENERKRFSGKCGKCGLWQYARCQYCKHPE